MITVIYCPSLSFLPNLSNQKYVSTTRALAEQELKTNIAETEVFVLPSGQQIQKEGIIHIYKQLETNK